MKRVIGYFVSAAMVCSMLAETGITALAEEASADRYEYVAFAIGSDPGDLSPWDFKSGQKEYIYTIIYDYLFDYIDGEYVPCVAKGYTEVDDLHWDVEIFDYVHDYQGNPITAQDIVFDYENFVNSGYAMKYDVFESVEALDDYTLRFTWAKPVTAVGALEFIFCNTPLYSQKAYEEGNFATQPVGSGPYYVESYSSGSKVTCVANDNYWQTEESLIPEKRARNVQTIDFVVVGEASQNVVGLQNGNLDFSMFVPNENVADFSDGGKNDEAFDVVSFMTHNTYYLALDNSEGAATADINLRKAIYYGIDNEALATAVGSAVACKAFGSNTSADYVDAWEEEENYINIYDPELAKEYLEASSYNGETLILLAGNDETYKNAATVIQAFLVNLGINCELSLQEEAQVTSNSTDPDAWDLYLAECGGSFLVGAMNRTFNKDEYTGDYCIGFISDDELQELYEIASTEETWNDESVTNIFHHVVDNAYLYTLFCDQYNFVYTSDVEELYFWDIFILPNACTYTTSN